MTWFSIFTRVPALAVATPIAVVVAIWIAAMYDYRLEITAIGLRFDKPAESLAINPTQSDRDLPQR